MNELTFIEGVQGLSMGVFYRGLGWTKDEIEVRCPSPSPAQLVPSVEDLAKPTTQLYLVNVRKSLRDRSVHAYSKV